MAHKVEEDEETFYQSRGIDKLSLFYKGPSQSTSNTAQQPEEQKKPRPPARKTEAIRSTTQLLIEEDKVDQEGGDATKFKMITLVIHMCFAVLTCVNSRLDLEALKEALHVQPRRAARSHAHRTKEGATRGTPKEGIPCFHNKHRSGYKRLGLAAQLQITLATMRV